MRSLALRLGPRRLFALLCHLPKFARLFWRLLRDPRVPLGPKLFLLGLLVYLLAPVDLVPDLLPVLGQADDAALLLLGLKAFLHLCPPGVVMEHVRDLGRR